MSCVELILAWLAHVVSHIKQSSTAGRPAAGIKWCEVHGQKARIISCAQTPVWARAQHNNTGTTWNSVSMWPFPLNEACSFLVVLKLPSLKRVRGRKEGEEVKECASVSAFNFSRSLLWRSGYEVKAQCAAVPPAHCSLCELFSRQEY